MAEFGSDAADFDPEQPSSSGNFVSWKERLDELRTCPWYWAGITWRSSERLLDLCDDGTFLLRDSRDSRHVFTISYRHNEKVYHTRIPNFGSFSSPGNMNLMCAGIVQWLEYAIQTANGSRQHMLMHRRGAEAQADLLRLSSPLSRHDVLPSLQFLCRLRLRSLLLSPSMDPLPPLLRPLPPHLRVYMTDPKYLLPDMDAAVAVLERRMGSSVDSPPSVSVSPM